MATEVSPDVVGNAFVYQYYHILHQSPELVHRFYQDVSKLGRPDGLGMSTTTTMHAINEKILSLGYGEFVAEIASVDSQESYNGGVLVLVTGHLTGSDNVRQKFSQSFFLAPQEKGYFVLNDVFRYVDDTKGESGSQDHVNNADAPVTVTESSSIREVYIAEAATTVHEEVKEEEVYNPAENGDGSVEDEEVPVPEVVDEIPDDSQVGADKQLVVESNNKNEELPKKSYASIVKVLKGNSSLFSTPTPSPIKSAPPKPQEPVNSVLSTPSATETHDSSSNANGIGNAHDVEEGPSIYVKGLPSDATPALLERIFKTFGPIRPGGIQVRFVKGFSFGFVEFEVASAVQSALEASPIMINGCRVVVEEKKSTSRGNRGRYPYGSGNGYREGSGNGYREGGRGRGNYGSKAYGQGDFSSRGEFGNRGNSRGGYSSRGGEGGGYSSRGGEGGGYSSRGGEGGGYSSRGGEGGGYSSRGGEGGGYSSRGGEGGGYANRGGEGGYRRADKMGNNGGRNKPLNGAAVAKTTAPQVSATA